MELEDENRKRLAGATSAKLELREDLSDHGDFHDTLSRLSAASNGAKTERIYEWRNSSPNKAGTNIHPFTEAPVTSTLNETLNAHTLVPPLQTVGNQAITEAVLTTTDVADCLTLFASVSPTLPSILHVPTTFQVAPRINSPISYYGFGNSFHSTRDNLNYDNANH